MRDLLVYSRRNEEQIKMKSSFLWYRRYLIFCTFAMKVAKNVSVNDAMSVCVSVCLSVCVWLRYLTTVSVSRRHSVGDRMINVCGVVCGIRIDRGYQSTLKETCPITALSAASPTWSDLRWNKGRWGEKPETDLLNYGMTLFAFSNSATFGRIFVKFDVTEFCKYLSTHSNFIHNRRHDLHKIL
jgi:hypothetical protein